MGQIGSKINFLLFFNRGENLTCNETNEVLINLLMVWENVGVMDMTGLLKDQVLGKSKTVRDREFGGDSI